MRLDIRSLLCLLTACFTEPPADRVWRCSVEQPLCPEGQTCVNDWCAKDGIATPDLASSSDGMQDMSMVKPCADGFPLGTQGVWACRGKFSPTTSVATALCQNGYKLCADGSRITDAECSNATIKGFFFADVPAQGSTGSVAKCAQGGVGNGSMWFGCGWYQGTRSPSERTQLPCKNLPLITYCDPLNNFTCNFTDLRLDAQKMDDARNGVLCCPP